MLQASEGWSVQMHGKKKARRPYGRRAFEERFLIAQNGISSSMSSKPVAGLPAGARAAGVRALGRSRKKASGAAARLAYIQAGSGDRTEKLACDCDLLAKSAVAVCDLPA